MKAYRRTLAALALSGCVGLAGAASAAIFTVDATVPVGSWQSIGSSFVAADTYDFTVINPATLWSAGAPPNRDSTADGINPIYYGTWTMDGFTANYGALVGENAALSTLSNPDGFFLIGTSAVVTGLSGNVTVGYWDSYYGDNSGFQTLSVNVPEPSAWALVLAGFAGLGAFIRARRGLTLTA